MSTKSRAAKAPRSPPIKRVRARVGAESNPVRPPNSPRDRRNRRLSGLPSRLSASSFASLPANCGMAFVVVSHQAPSGHEPAARDPREVHRDAGARDRRRDAGRSRITSTWRRAATTCRFARACSSAEQVAERGRPPLPIDFFFRALAHDQARRAVGIVLSGTGADGTLGLAAIRAGVRPVPRAGARDGRVRRHADQRDRRAGDRLRPADRGDAGAPARVRPRRPAAPERTREVPEVALDRAGADPRADPGARRPRLLDLQARHVAAAHRAAHGSASDRTTRRLRAPSGGERRRDRCAVAGLADRRQRLLPRPRGLPGAAPVPGFRRCSPRAKTGSALRIWVPGCATGEEAYSIAILLLETLEQLGKRLELQVFATDLDPAAIQTARAGRYPEGIAADVGRAASRAVLHQGGPQLPGQEGAARPRRVRRPERAARSALHARGPDLLPEPPDLHRSERATEPASRLPLQPESGRAPAARRVRERHRLRGALLGARQALEAVPTQRLGVSQAAGASVGPGDRRVPGFGSRPAARCDGPRSI